MFFALGFLAPLTGQSHLLNMTEVAVLAQGDGSVRFSLDIDLSRSMASPEAYFELANSLEQQTHGPMWQRIGDAIRLENQGQRIPLVFVGAENPRNYTQRDFFDPLIWPKVRLIYASEPRPTGGDYAIGVTFTSAFFFEEPIAVAMSAEQHERRINRWLVTDQKSPVLSVANMAAADTPRLAKSDVLAMLGAGFAHVLPGGIDHLLFLLGLSWLIASVKKLVAAVTLFTLAHCTSLLAASYKLVELNPLFIEVAILATIVWLGLGLLRSTRWGGAESGRTQTLASPGYGAVFFFGLIHGLGFANAFLALAITENVVAQLVAFNVGVELAQILFIALCAGVLFWLRRSGKSFRTSSLLIGGVLVIPPSVWAGRIISNAIYAA